MAKKTLKKFAVELKSAREKKAISLNEIHDKTRIDLKYLNEIENGNFDALPEVYMRGFLKKYAEMINLDPEEVINNFEAAKSENQNEGQIQNTKKIELDKLAYNKKPDTYDDLEEEETHDTEFKVDSQKRNQILISVFVFICVVILGLYYVFIHESSEEIVVEKPIEEIINEQNNPQVSESDTNPNSSNTSDITSSAIARDSLNLKIYAIDTTWMRVMIDNKFSDEFILKPKIARVLKAEANFNLLIGNAGGIELNLNGKKITQIGKIGEIKNINVDSAGIHYMRITKN